MEIRRSIFAENSGYLGGGLSIITHPHLDLEGCAFWGNTQNGGGLNQIYDPGNVVSKKQNWIQP